MKVYVFAHSYNYFFFKFILHAPYHKSRFKLFHSKYVYMNTVFAVIFPLSVFSNHMKLAYFFLFTLTAPFAVWLWKKRCQLVARVPPINFVPKVYI